MQCKTANFSGWGSCSKLLEKMNGAALQKKGTTMTPATAVSLSEWRTNIADDDSSVRNTLMLGILSFENTTDDVEITTSQLGVKSITSKPIPSGKLGLKCGLQDYIGLHELDGQMFQMPVFFQDGSYWLTKKSDGSLTGFTVQVDTVAGLPPEDKQLSYPMWINFQSYSEFENIVIVSPDFTFIELLDLSPVGLDISIVTPYSGGDVTVFASKRGTGEGMTGLSQTTDWEVMATAFGTTLPVAVTVVTEVGQGAYTLTIKKDTGGTPANLADIDWVEIQAHDDDGTYVTYLSNTLKIVGGA